jgi:tetratricopeptide (TPR) repeat protein
VKLSHFVVPLVLVFTFPSFADDQHQHALSEEEVGSVHFVTSCASTVEKDFSRAVALLHSFQYEQTRQAFEQVATRDPQCAMAQWGVAMSYYHGLWENSNVPAGRVALRKAEQIAATNPKTTAREKAYIEALGEVYREDDKDLATHGRAFEQKMATVQASYPEDSEAAVFHALTLAITAPKTDKTFSNQRKCGEILEPLFQKQPHHPGIAHYIIHCYDNPVLAEQGLGAARLYAKIAPASAHAHHMPSHLFTRVGSWSESIESNKRSAEVAAAAESTSKNGEARDQRLHAMQYLEYAYLQNGQVDNAKRIADEMQTLPPVPEITQTGHYSLAAVPARLALELGNWEQASQIQPRKDGVPWAQAVSWMAIGVGSARSNNQARAAEAERMLASLRDQTTKMNNTYWANQIEVQRQEVAAWIAQASGKRDDAVKTMRSAADLEESMEKSPATPGAIVPAREMLAQLLALEHQPKEALTEFQAVLKVSPNRFNALYGAAVAAEAAGQKDQAKNYYAKLSEVAPGDQRKEQKVVRQKLSSLSASTNH